MPVPKYVVTDVNKLQVKNACLHLSVAPCLAFFVFDSCLQVTGSFQSSALNTVDVTI